MKKVITIFIVALALALPVRAQVFMVEDDHNMRSETEDVLGIVPMNGQTLDQANDPEAFAPLGEGILLLTALGGAYLLNKKRKNKSHINPKRESL